MVPNAEQESVLATAATDGLRVMVIGAGAGCGKTATLKMLEQVLPGRGQYTAFNTSLVTESKSKFVKARCNTTHSLAFGAVVSYTGDTVSGTGSGGSNPPWDTIRAQLDALAKEVMYWRLNRIAWQVAAAAVAPPVLATATVTTQVKSTATTQLVLNGILISLTATDPLLLVARQSVAHEPVHAVKDHDSVVGLFQNGLVRLVRVK